MSLQAGLSRKLDDNIESCRGQRYEKAVGKVCDILERDGTGKFPLSRGHVEVILLLASVNMDNH